MTHAGVKVGETHTSNPVEVLMRDAMKDEEENITKVTRDIGVMFKTNEVPYGIAVCACVQAMFEIAVQGWGMEKHAALLKLVGLLATGKLEYVEDDEARH
jgi:hypothetical protein